MVVLIVVSIPVDAKSSVELILRRRAGIWSTQSIVEEELECQTRVFDEVPVVLTMEERFERVGVWAPSTHCAVIFGAE
jgi:hypothetical protein